MPIVESSLDEDLTPGQQVGEYVVESKLGQGGFGAVFKAVHPVIGKVVAIKVLSRRFSVDPQMLARFVAEARAVNQIRHRYIIDIFSFGQLQDGRHYYVMEYLEGESLGDRIKREGRLSLEDALPILYQVARALDAAHTTGIAHRDLKPDNIYLVHDDLLGVVPKLLDFGIAKLMRSNESRTKTATGIPIGTPHYMSPEQCHGRGVDHRTDYYAFGVLTFVTLTGKFPLDADDPMSILMRQISEDPPPPSSIVPELPPKVDELVARCMAKNPAQRPANLTEAVTALGETLEVDGWRTPVPGTVKAFRPATRPGSEQDGEKRSLRNRPPSPDAPAPVQVDDNRSARNRLAEKSGTDAPTMHHVSPRSGDGKRRARRGTWSKRAVWIGAALAALVAGAAIAIFAISAATSRDESKPVAATPVPESTTPTPTPARETATPVGDSTPQPTTDAAVLPAPDAVVEDAPEAGMDMTATSDSAVAIDAGSAADAVPPSAPTVAVTIHGTPSGLEVSAGSQRLGTGSGPFKLPHGTRERELTFRKDGFAAETRRIIPNRDQTLRVKLAPVQRESGSNATKQDSAEARPASDPDRVKIVITAPGQLATISYQGETIGRAPLTMQMPRSAAAVTIEATFSTVTINASTKKKRTEQRAWTRTVVPDRDQRIEIRVVDSTLVRAEEMP